MKHNPELKAEAIRLRVEEHKTLSEISTILGLSKSTLSTYLRGYPLPEGLVREKLQESYKGSLGSEERKKRLKALYGEDHHKVRTIKEGLSPISESIETYKRGFIGEAYVRYRLLREGFEISIPSALEPGCDLIVRGKSGKYYRCEIKSSSNNIIGFRNTKFVPKGGYRAESYKNYDVDLFIACLLNMEEIFILPREVVLSGGNSYSFSELGTLYEYKDRFDLIE